MARPDNPQWHIDPQEVAELLGSQPESIRNGAFGAGQRFEVGEGTLELFSKAGVAKVRNKDGSLTGQVRSAEEPTVDLENARLIFFQPEPRAALVFRQDGSFESVSSPEALRAVENSGTAARKESVPASLKDAPAADPVPADEASEDESDTVVDASNRFRQETDDQRERGEQDERLKFSGRMGDDPRFRRTSKSATPIARFPVAQHVQDDTVWHRVVAFNDVAEGLEAKARAGVLKKGQSVQVTGYRQEREYEGKDGKTHTVVEIRAIGVAGKDDKENKWSVWAKKKPASPAAANK